MRAARGFSFPRPLRLLALLTFGLFVLAPAQPARAWVDRAIGDVVVRDGQTVDSATTAIGDITIEPGAHVRGNVSSGMGNILIEGQVDGSVNSGSGNVRILAPVAGGVKAGNGNVYVNAPVGGDVEVGHGSIHHGPRAWFGGSIICRSCSMPDESRDVSASPAVTGVAFQSGGGLRDAGSGAGGGAGLVGWGLGTLAFVACSVLLAMVLPRPLASAARSIEWYPGRSLLVGAASVPLFVVLGVVLAVSVVGGPVLVLLVPAYFGLALFGTVATAYFLGRRTLFATGRYRSGNAAAAIVGALLVAVSALVPILGALILCGLVLLGLGATVLAVFSRGRR